MRSEPTSSQTIAANEYPYAPVRAQSSITDHYRTRKRIRIIFEGERLRLLKRALPAFFAHVDSGNVRSFWGPFFAQYFEEFPWQRLTDGPARLAPEEVDECTASLKNTQAVRPLLSFLSPFI